VPGQLAAVLPHCQVGWSLSLNRDVCAARASEYRIGREVDYAGDFPVRYCANSLDRVSQWDEGPQYEGVSGLRVREVSRAATSEYDEFRVTPEHREGMGESADFEFAAGFTSTLVQTGVRLIDRSTIMRLIAHDQIQDDTLGDNSDYQKVEATALLSYSDYLAEITYSPRSGESNGEGFMVAVKEVKSGRLVAMFRMDATPEQQAGQEKWVATEEGYQLVVEEAPEPSLYDMGEQVKLPERQLSLKQQLIEGCGVV
jgi:hypothetical protein